jgi:hypothetical protein
LILLPRAEAVTGLGDGLGALDGLRPLAAITRQPSLTCLPAPNPSAITLFPLLLALPDRAGSELAAGNKGAITTVGNVAPVVVTPPVGPHTRCSPVRAVNWDGCAEGTNWKD